MQENINKTIFCQSKDNKYYLDDIIKGDSLEILINFSTNPPVKRADVVAMLGPGHSSMFWSNGIGIPLHVCPSFNFVE